MIVCYIDFLLWNVHFFRLPLFLCPLICVCPGRLCQDVEMCHEWLSDPWWNVDLAFNCFFALYFILRVQMRLILRPSFEFVSTLWIKMNNESRSLCCGGSFWRRTTSCASCSRWTRSWTTLPCQWRLWPSGWTEIGTV